MTADGAPKTVEVFAPAKINLTLHVVGRREDGYHLLDSLVVFATLGDTIELTEAPRTTLRVRGPFASDVPAGRDNLVHRAVRLMDAGAAITLNKRLPVGAGIGGGSADAAAALRGLAELAGRRVPDTLALGADVPVCTAGRAARMSGVGEVLRPLPALPALPMVLVFPDASVSTSAVFAGLKAAEGAPMPDIPVWRDVTDAADWLHGQRNDLQTSAIRVAPAILGALDALVDSSQCLLARMSGSGSTVFGLFASDEAAQEAARRIAEAQPRWWVQATQVLRQAPAVQERRLTT